MTDSRAGDIPIRGGRSGDTMGTPMRCPDCGSVKATCTYTLRTHVHECGDCGLRHEWARTSR